MPTSLGVTHTEAGYPYANISDSPWTTHYRSTPSSASRPIPGPSTYYPEERTEDRVRALTSARYAVESWKV